MTVGTSVVLSVNASLLGQLPSPTPVLPQPVEQPLPQALATAFDPVMDFRRTGMIAFNRHWSQNYSSNTDTPITTNRQPLAYRGHVDRYQGAFTALDRSLRDELIRLAALGPREFGDLGATGNQLTTLRNTTVDAAMGRFHRQCRATFDQVTSFSRLAGSARQPEWRRQMRDLTEPERRFLGQMRGMRPGEMGPAREMLSQRELEFIRTALAASTALRTHLESQYNTRRTAYVSSEIARQRYTYSSETVLAAGGVPVTRNSATPACPPATHNAGIYTLTQGPYTIQMRRDPSGGPDGAWQYRRVIQGRPDQPWSMASTPLTDGSFNPVNNPAREQHRVAINNELRRLATPEITHYVVTQSTPRTGQAPLVETLHIRFHRTGNDPHQGTWQWRRPSENTWNAMTVTIPVPAVAATDPTRIAAESWNATFGRIARRAALPANQLAAERAVVDSELDNRIRAERVHLAQTFFNGPVGSLYGVTSRSVQVDGRACTEWMMSSGRCQAEIREVRNPSNVVTGYVWRYRFGADGSRSTGPSGAVDHASAWSEWQPLPTRTHVIPRENDPNNGRNPAYEGFVEISNRLHGLRRMLYVGGADAAGTLAAVRAEGETLARLAQRPLHIGRSHDPGENILRTIFRATDAHAVHGPGVLQASIGGVNLLFRRMAPAGGNARLQAGYGLWQVALNPPGGTTAVPEGGWHLFRPDQAQSTGWRNLEGPIRGPNTPPRILAASQLLGRLLYSEPWTPGRPHPVVTHLFSSTDPNSNDRFSRSFTMGRSVLIGSGVDTVTNTAAGPNARPATAAMTVTLTGAPLTTQPQVRMVNGFWEVNLTGTWHRADTAGALYQLPTSGAFDATTYGYYQRYNQIFTLLGELNRGIALPRTGS